MALAVLHTPGEWFKRYTAAGKFSALSIGCFDGLHLGHQEVLRRVVARARALGTSVAGVVTFETEVLNQNHGPVLVYTDKLLLMRKK